MTDINFYIKLNFLPFKYTDNGNKKQRTNLDSEKELELTKPLYDILKNYIGRDGIVDIFKLCKDYEWTYKQYTMFSKKERSDYENNFKIKYKEICVGHYRYETVPEQHTIQKDLEMFKYQDYENHYVTRINSIENNISGYYLNLIIDGNEYKLINECKIYECINDKLKNKFK